MNLLDSTKLALLSLRLQKIRALLTTLGIVIGVAAVIAMLSISEGAKREAMEQIRVLGVNNIRIKSVPPVVGDREQQEEQNRSWILEYGVKEKELEHMRVLSEEILEIIPIREVRKDVWAGDKKTDIRVVGTTPGLAGVLGYRLEGGRFLTDLDGRQARRVCVLGAKARRKLFGFKSWIDEDVKVGGLYFRVVGVMEGKSVTSGGPVEATDVDNQIYLPYRTVRTEFGSVAIKWASGSSEQLKVEVDEAVVRVSSEEAILPVARILRHALERKHPKGDYEVVVPLELLRQSQRTQRTFTIVMASIAALSLLVGGIGIMNIMLANIAERRKEIGTRRALGARKRDISRQFLAESVVLSLLGGLVGILCGGGASVLIQRFAEWKTVVSPVAVVLAFVVAGATGILFGTWPAVKAAALDPIEALREQ